MKKRKKGSPGYLDYKKRMEILRAVIYFLIVAAILMVSFVGPMMYFRWKKWV